MARAIWKGSIAFGLVSIPVELFSAVREHRPRFRLLHAKDESPVHYERVCQRDGTSVAWDDLVKGYEYEKGQFVVLTKDDFKTAALEKTKTIDILDFVPPEEIDERYFETPYYLQPGKGADHSYALLRDAIVASGRIGVGTIILRESQHLAAIEVIGEALVLTMMRFADELADLDDFRFPTSGKTRPAELKMAEQLIASFSAAWKPEKYTDQYQANLMKVIEGKLKGRRPKLQDTGDQPKGEVLDLMERLRASLEEKTGTGTRKAGSASKRKAASARTARAGAKGRGTRGTGATRKSA